MFLNANSRISIKTSLNFVPRVPINNIPALVLIMAWCRPGDKPLAGPTMVCLLTHIWVTRPQWVKAIACSWNKKVSERLASENMIKARRGAVVFEIYPPHYFGLSLGPLLKVQGYNKPKQVDTSLARFLVFLANFCFRVAFGACRRCSDYIFILHLTPNFNGLDKDNCKTKWETFKFCNSVRLILEIWRYIWILMGDVAKICVQ